MYYTHHLASYDWQTNVTSQNWQTNVTSQNSTHIISGLAAGNLYEIRVMTSTTKGDSPFSDVLSVRTNDRNYTQLEELQHELGIDIINDKIVSKSYKE